MKELVIISGKGGTGKTSLAASFAVLADETIVADCDVDAADLHLVLSPKVLERHEFRSGHEAIIRRTDCVGCGACREHCRFGAVIQIEAESRKKIFSIDSVLCEGCGVCVRFCPQHAIDFPERLCGEWMISETRCGSMIHARLGIAAENSGKLVSTVREEARRKAEQDEKKLIITDGPPGIGCPVIASLTGASVVLIVTEPTVSGMHDLKRVLSLSRHFGIPALVCVNKWDINPELTYKIEKAAAGAGAEFTERIPYDKAVTAAQLNNLAVVEFENGNNIAAERIREVWKTICRKLQ